MSVVKYPQACLNLSKILRGATRQSDLFHCFEKCQWKINKGIWDPEELLVILFQKSFFFTVLLLANGMAAPFCQ